MTAGAESEFDAGMDLFTGVGGTYDTVKAYEFFARGAARGHPKSQAMCEIMKVMSAGKASYADREVVKAAMDRGITGSHADWVLGKIFELGIVGAPSGSEPLDMYRAAADKGSCMGLYELGRGLRAETVLAKAVDMGCVPAMLRLAEILVRGDAESIRRAEELYRKGLARGSEDCGVRLAWMRVAGLDSRTEEIDLPGLLDGPAEKGDVIAQCLLGFVYRHGICVPISYERALYHFLQASDQGSSFARCQLGLMYEFGVGVEESVEMARYFYKQSSTGLVRCRLGLMYEEGIVDEKELEFTTLNDLVLRMYLMNNLEELAQYRIAVMREDGRYDSVLTATDYYKVAAEAGNPIAMYRLARIYMGSRSKRKQAFRLCSQAADCCLPEAEMMMAEFYSEGIVVRRSKDIARMWLERARIHGHPDADEMMQRLESKGILDRLR